MTTRIALLSSGTGSLFRYLLDRHSSDERVTFVGVIVESPNSALLDLASSATPFAVHERRSVDSRETYSDELLATLREWQPDWLLMAFDHVLAGSILAEYEDRILNVHYSLLPAFRGTNPVPRAIAAGVRHAGATIHVAVAEVDAGAAVVQTSIPVDTGWSAQNLQHALYGHMQTMASNVIEWLAEDAIRVEDGRVTVDGAAYGTTPINPSRTV